MVCPIKDANWHTINNKHGKAAANAVALFFGTDAFQKWYGSTSIPMIVDGEYIYNNKGESMTVSSIISKYQTTKTETTKAPTPVRSSNISTTNVIGQTFTQVVDHLKSIKNSYAKDSPEAKFIDALDSNSNLFKGATIKLLNDPNSAAYYDSTENAIYIYSGLLEKTDDATLNRVLLHELVHVATMAPFTKISNYIRQTGTDPLDFTEGEMVEKALAAKAITAKEAKFVLTTMSLWYKASLTSKRFEAAKNMYGLTDPREFVAEMVSNPQFYKFLRDNEESIFTKFWKNVLEFFGIKMDIESPSFDSFMTQIIEQAKVSMEEGFVKDTFEEAKSYIKLDEISNKFSDIVLAVDESHYLDGARTPYDRLTNWIKKTFSANPADLGDAIYEKKAEEIYRSLGVDKSNTIKIKNFLGTEETYTFQQLVDKQKIDQNTAIAYGNIAHLMIERAIRIATSLPIDGINNKIEELRKAKPDQNAIDLSRMQWLGNISVLGPLFRRLGLNFTDQTLATEAARDKMKSEVPVASKLLGVATKIDMLVQHADEAVSIFDWKTGTSFFKDEMTSLIMKYSSGYFQANDSRVNKSKLEIILRAMMIKESFPEVKFREMAVVHLDRQGADRILPADFEMFIPMVEAYVKAERPAVYQEMKDKGLFNPADYRSSSRASVELDAATEGAKSVEEQVQYAEQALMSLTASRDLNTVALDSDAKQTAADLTLAVLEKTKGKSVSPSVDDTPMGNVKRWIGNIYSTGNPLVQAFIQYFTKAKDKAYKELDKLFAEEDQKLKAVVDEYYDKNPGAKLANKLVNGITWHKEDGTGLFDFMWEFVESIDEPGWYTRIITEKDVQQGRFTQAQYEYNKFQREKMQQYYKEVMGASVLGTKTRAELENKPMVLPANFAPRSFITRDDIIERHGAMSRKMLDYQSKRYLSTFMENELYGKKDNVALPLKYIGNPSIIGSQNHTFNSQSSFRLFMTNLIMKKHLDPAYSVGQGVKGILDLQGARAHADPDHYKTTRDFVNDLIKAQIQNIDNEVSYTRKDIKIGKKTVNIQKTFDLLRNFVSSSTMWLQPASGAFNTLLIMTLNTKAAVSGSLGSNAYKDFGAKDLAFGMKEWAASIRKGDNSKLMQIAKSLRYLPNNYDYAAHSSKMLSSKHTMVSKDKLYMFHSIGEDMGQLSLLAAMLHHQKNPKTGKSMWEEYDDNGVWQGGVRGVSEAGEIITGLTSEEITNMKRVSQKIHGGYRDSERTALEMGALGRWALQFKKYLPAIFESIWTTAYTDASQGEWVKREAVEGTLFDKAGNPVFKEITLEDGTVVKEDIYEWHARLQEGRLNTLIGIIMQLVGMKNDPNYTLGSLGAAQKKNLIDLSVAASFMTLIFLGMASGFDDDDEDSKIYRKFARYREDISQGMWPMDLIRSVQQPFVALTKFKQSLEAFGTFMVEGVIQDKRTQEGRYPGAAQLMRTFPITSSIENASDYSDEYFELSLH